MEIGKDQVMNALTELVLADLSEGVLVARQEGGRWYLAYSNPTARSMLNLGETGWCGRDPIEVIEPFLDPQRRDLFSESFEKEEVFLEEIHPATGDPEHVLSVRCHFSEEGGFPCWIGILENLDARRRLSRDLYYERERSAQVLRQIKDGVVVANPQGEVQYLNRVAEQLTGWKRTEAAGESTSVVVRLIDSVSREPVTCPLQKVVQSGLEIGETSHCDLLNRVGQSSRVSYLVTPLESGDGMLLGAVMIFRDETVKKRLEEEQVKTESLEILSVLVGGVAHDLNNFLMGITGNLSLAELGDSLEETRVRMARIGKATERARRLSQQLLSLSRGNPPVMAPGGIENLAREVCQFTLAGSGVELRVESEDSLCNCLMEEGRISQVLTNLVLNARQAMEDHGELAVSIRNLEINRKSGLPLRSGPYVCVEIQDTGPGIRAEHLPRIFDPYFTTKSTGSGLGLANCRAIIRQHRGHISVESEPEKGTVFRIYLQATEEESLEKPSTEDKTVYHGKGRVLVMDDEDLVRQIGGDILEHLGYEPLFAEDGEEVLERVQEAHESGSPLAAIILDLTVPGRMGGMDAKKYLERLAPEIPVIVSSGYSNDPIMSRCEEYGFACSALKPYTIQQLSVALRRAIGEEGSEKR